MLEQMESRLTVREVDPADDRRWSRFVEGASDGTFCHHWGWQAVMRNALGHQPRYLAAVDEAGEWRGVLPLVEVKSRIFGRYLVSVPFLNYGGPIGSESARHALAEEAVAHARAERVDLLELRSREPVPGGLRTSDRKVTVTLPLPNDPETLWKDGLRSKLRSQIRRPMKEGFETSEGVDQLGAFYEVFTRTMRDLGTPVLSRRFFKSIVTEMGGIVRISVVRDGATPIAAGLGFLWNGELEITWAGADRRYSRSAPNMLMYWSMMRSAIGDGASLFNFGRCTPGSGTHRFKRQWGGEDVPLPWAQWSPGRVASTPSPDRPVFRLATSVWSRLPLPLANAIGPALSRSLP